MKRSYQLTQNDSAVPIEIPRCFLKPPPGLHFLDHEILAPPPCSFDIPSPPPPEFDNDTYMLIRLQTWWRARATRKRFVALTKARSPWKQILHANESLIHGSLCEVHGKGLWSSPKLKLRFVMYTTQGRVLICDPIKKSLIATIAASEEDGNSLRSRDVGSIKNFGKASEFAIYKENVPGEYRMSDLLFPSQVWTSLLLGNRAPDAEKLTRICRVNSMRSLNFCQIHMGQVWIREDVGMLKQLGCVVAGKKKGQARFAVLHGSSILCYKENELETTIAIDHLTDVIVDSDTKLILRTAVLDNGVQFRFMRKDQRDSWAQALQEIVTRQTRVEFKKTFVRKRKSSGGRRPIPHALQLT